MTIILKGTTEVIFDAAIEQFSSFGYENVSMRDIAKQAKIKAPSIYNHFLSKNKILEEIYAYFSQHFQDNQKSSDELKELMRVGTKNELMRNFMFTFETPDQKKYRRLVLITKIIYMRVLNDDKANQIFLKLMNEEVETYAKKILEYGVSIGRLKPFDMRTYLALLVGQRHIIGIKAFASPNYVVQQLEEEEQIMNMLTDLLPFNEEYNVLRR